MCVVRSLHGADVGVEAGEHDASPASFLQHAGQDGVQEQVHVEVGQHVSIPRAVLSTTDTKSCSCTTQSCSCTTQSCSCTTQSCSCTTQYHTVMFMYHTVTHSHVSHSHVHVSHNTTLIFQHKSKQQHMSFLVLDFADYHK